MEKRNNNSLMIIYGIAWRIFTGNNAWILPRWRVDENRRESEGGKKKKGNVIMLGECLASTADCGMVGLPA